MTAGKDPGVSSSVRKRTSLSREDRISHLKGSVQMLIDSMSTDIAIVTQDWSIVRTNEAWKRSAAESRFPALLALGQNLFNFWDWRRRSGSGEAEQILRWMQDFAGGSGQRAAIFARDVDGTSWQLSLSRFDVEDVRYTVFARTNVTEVARLRREKRNLNIDLMRAEMQLARVHEEERLKIARDLHDSAAQHLVGMNLAIATLKSIVKDDAAAATVAELSAMLGDFHRDLRAITYLFHPPELERHGLHGAVTGMCHGFAKRVGVHMVVRTHGSPRNSLSPPELAAYRLVQEALTNIHRHAGASHVRVRLSDRAEGIYLAVLDDGKGLSTKHGDSGETRRSAIGVGLAGMIARAAELGGVIRIASRKPGTGTKIVAYFPRDGGGRSFIPPLRHHARAPDRDAA